MRDEDLIDSLERMINSIDIEDRLFYHELMSLLDLLRRRLHERG
jgi:hypothetical protein